MVWVICNLRSQENVSRQNFIAIAVLRSWDIGLTSGSYVLSLRLRLSSSPRNQILEVTVMASGPGGSIEILVHHG